MPQAEKCHKWGELAGGAGYNWDKINFEKCQK